MNIYALPSFPRKRESSQFDDPRIAGQPFVFRLLRRFLICWIPVFAGMTK
jgi:hypothetical protein